MKTYVVTRWVGAYLQKCAILLHLGYEEFSHAYKQPQQPGTLPNTRYKPEWVAKSGQNTRHRAKVHYGYYQT